jgi:hypothetical protein
VLRGIADVAKEAMAPIVERPAETRAPGEAIRVFQLTGSKRKSFRDITSGFGVRVLSAGTNLSAVAAARAVNVIVDAPNQTVSSPTAR